MELLIKCTKCLLVMDESELLEESAPGVARESFKKRKSI